MKKSTITAKSYSNASYILPTPAATTKPVATKHVDAEYENWKRANGLDKPLSRERYEVVFGIYN